MKSCALITIQAFVLLVSLAFLATCSPSLSLGKQVQKLGTLRVAMVNSATTYYKQGKTAAGFEYDLVHQFARDMKLQLDIIQVRNRHAAIQAVQSGRAHMAAGIAISKKRRKAVNFTPAYTELTFDVIYNTHTPSPDSVADLDKQLTIQLHSVLGEKLNRLHPDLTFDAEKNTNPEELMARVARGELFGTIATTSLAALNQRYYPKLRVAFKLPDIKRKLAWAFPENADAGLYNQAIAWLEKARQSGFVKLLRQRYFAHAQRLGFLGGRIFAKLARKRLPQWRDLFKQAAEKYDLDWRLLAAMGYQESHWDSNAVSPTGVRGLMMLTNAAASEVGVSNRLDPKQSIFGGARYLVMQRQRLPERIEQPDRMWLTLAAYNIGLGHLMDARRLLKARGRNPNLWVNVSEALTWLTQQKYLDETRYGYAPGYQAVEYVGNIRAYYDILKWMTGDRSGEKPKALKHTSSKSKAGKPDITIESPAL